MPQCEPQQTPENLYVDPSSIGPLEDSGPVVLTDDDSQIYAFVLAGGDSENPLRRTHRAATVYGLIAGGYVGMRFGDSETNEQVGVVAVGIPIDGEGRDKIASFITEAAKRKNPFACVELLTSITESQAKKRLIIALENNYRPKTSKN